MHFKKYEEKKVIGKKKNETNYKASDNKEKTN